MPKIVCEPKKANIHVQNQQFCTWIGGCFSFTIKTASVHFQEPEKKVYGTQKNGKRITVFSTITQNNCNHTELTDCTYSEKCFLQVAKLFAFYLLVKHINHYMAAKDLFILLLIYFTSELKGYNLIFHLERTLSE